MRASSLCLRLEKYELVNVPECIQFLPWIGIGATNVGDTNGGH